ncbi:MAG: alpha-L-fucosidase [Fimbriimonadaceae bacterium]|nr:alpha-L-fucosidase [Fimbriimonadaceae bacterium]
MLSILAAMILAQNLPKPTPEQLAWQDAEIGMFIHFAPNTWQDNEGDDLSTPMSAIHPAKLDTDQWARTARSMGAKYIVFVAKHVGGFCWWQTTTTDYSVKSTPWKGGKGDVMADLAKSCQKFGLKLGVYLSPMDRKFGVAVGGKAKTPEVQSAYEKRFRTQLTELLSRYGPIFEVWFDGSLVFPVGDILEKYAPKAVVFQGPHASIRWVGNEEGFAPYPSWNGAKFDPKTWGTLTSADGDPDGDRWLPNEVDCRMRNTWFWNTHNAGSLKSVDKLMEMYEKSVGHGAVLLLNNTPDTSGLIPEADVKRSAEFGAEIERRYGLAIADVSGKGEVVSVSPSAPSVIDAVVTMEEIAEGERVREYAIEGRVDGEWKVIAHGTAIGHKKIDKFEPVRVSEVRLRVVKSVGTPLIRRLALYRTGG